MLSKGVVSKVYSFFCNCVLLEDNLRSYEYPFSFFLRFYLFIHDRHREREREAETQAEGEAGSLRATRCRTRSQDPGITP